MARGAGGGNGRRSSPAPAAAKAGPGTSCKTLCSCFRQWPPANSGCRSSAWTRCSSSERITSRWKTRSWHGGIAGADRTHVAHWFVGSCVTGRGDLTEAEWRRLEPLLPTGNNRCGRWRDHRQVVNGILHRVRTGVQWRDLPERYGPWKTVYERHRRWSADGTWERLLQQVQAQVDAAGGIDWDVSVDSTSIRAHQHAAGARKAPPPAASKGAATTAHQSGRPWVRLCARLAEVVQEVRRSVAPEEASPSRFT